MKFILPGMGANSKMYPGPWRGLKDSCFIDWPPYKQEKSIADVAKAVIEQNRITRDDLIIGSSLGGMAGLEIAHILGSQQVVLIGSAIHSNEISFLGKILMPFAGKPVVKFSQMISSFSKALISRMYSSADPDFIVSMSKAILNWEGVKSDIKTVVRIHGEADAFITCPSDCNIIKRGGHLIAMTHAGECVNILNSIF